MENKPDFQKAISEANRILEENYITTPPIPVWELAENYDLRVYVAKFEDTKVCGYLEFNDKEIVVNKQDGQKRQHFTIAHELGHWILHKSYLEKDNDLGIVYRNPLANDKEWIEQEANCFAANLLVPSHMLQIHIHLSNEAIAKIFDVSAIVIAYRRQLLNGK